MKGKQEDHVIVAIHVTDRARQAPKVQSILTAYGANIKTRVGLHEADGRSASPNGVIILEMIGSPKKSSGLIAELNALKGVQAEKIVFAH